jgi:hypothetical protein
MSCFVIALLFPFFITYYVCERTKRTLFRFNDAGDCTDISTFLQLETLL